MKKALFVILVLTLALGLAATGSLAKDKVTLNVTTWWSLESGGAIDTLKKAFEAANPDISLNLIRIPKSYATKLLTMIVGGDSPDVAMLAMDRVGQYASKGALYDIDELVKKDYPLDDMWPSLKKALQYNGHFVALPRDCTTNLLYYNKKLFDEAGVAYPTEDWTWDDFLAAAKKLTKYDKSGIPTQYGFAFQTYADGWYTWVLSAGGSMVNETRTRSTVNTPEFIKAAQFMADLRNKYHVAPTTSQAKALGDASQMFAAGKLAMMVDDVAASDSFADIKTLSWDVAPAPAPKGMPHKTRIWTNTWVIPKGTKNIDAAWRLVKWLAGPEGQKIAAEQHMGIPALKSVAYSKAFLNNKPEHKKYFLEAFSYGEPFPTFDGLSEYLTIYEREFDSMFNGDRTAAEAAAAIDKEANSTIFNK